MKKPKQLFVVLAMLFCANAGAEVYEEYLLEAPGETPVEKSAIIDYDTGECLNAHRHPLKKPAVIRFYAQTGGTRALISEEFCKRGKLEGVAKFYYPDGRLQQESPFKNGKLHGEEKHYAKTGEVTRVEKFHKGVSHEGAKMFDDHGNPVFHAGRAPGL